MVDPDSVLCLPNVRIRSYRKYWFEGSLMRVAVSPSSDPDGEPVGDGIGAVVSPEAACPL
jgi:hypothetical protein